MEMYKHSDLARATDGFIAEARRLVAASQIVAPPIDPALLARVRGIQRVVVSRHLDVSGQLNYENGELVVLLNAKEPPERRNFSCCHEIAHTFRLGSSAATVQAPASRVDCATRSPEEYLCDRAAAEMLMPEQFFRPRASGLEPNIESLVRLSRCFQSSIGATIVRLGQVAVWPVVFIVWKFKTRLGSSPKLRVSWSVRPANSRCFVPRHVPADLSSGMYAAFVTSRTTVERETLDLGTLRGRYLVESARFGDHVASIVHDPRLSRGI